MRAMAVVLSLWLATACTGSGTTDVAVEVASQPSAGAPALDVSVQIGRLAATRGLIDLELSPEREASEVEITSLQLVDPRFEVAAPTARVTTVDRLLHIAVDPGTPICGGASADPPLTAVTVPGTPEPFLLPIDAAGQDVLTRLHGSACQRQAILDAADIGFSPEWTPAGRATARGTIAVERSTSGVPITLHDVQGTVIFALEVLPTTPRATDPGTAAHVARLGPEEQRQEVPVEVSAARCDAHGLAESKKTFLFPAWVSIGDAPVGFIGIEPQGEARAALEGLMTIGCHE